MVGKIPNKIRYTFRKETSRHVLVRGDNDESIINKICLPVMVADLDAACEHNEHLVGMRWLNNCESSVADEILDKLTDVSTTSENTRSKHFNRSQGVTTIELENAPFEICLVKYDWYDKNGYYRAITSHDFYVDIRAPVLVDTILSCGVEKGGKIPAQFVWGRINNGGLQLIRVGSKLHISILDYMKRLTMMPVSVSNLKDGGIYRGKKKRDRVLIGCVNTSSDTCEPKNMLLWFHLDTSGDSPETQLADYLKITEYDPAISPMYNFSALPTSRLVAAGRGPTLYNKERHYPWDRLVITAGNSSIEKCGEVDLPSNVLALIQDNMISIMRSHINHMTAKMNDMIMYASDKKIYRQRLLVFYKEKVHIRRPGARVPDVLEYTPEYKLLDNFGQS